MHVLCPGCGSKLKISDRAIGKTATCPKCATKMIIPVSAPPQTPESAPPSPFANLDGPPHQYEETRKPRILTPVVEYAPPVLMPADEPCDDEKPALRSRRNAKVSRSTRESKAGFQCPYCSSPEVPVRREKVTGAGLAVMIVLFFVCFPMCLVGLLMREQYTACAECGIRLGGSTH